MTDSETIALIRGKILLILEIGHMYHAVTLEPIRHGDLPADISANQVVYGITGSEARTDKLKVARRQQRKRAKCLGQPKTLLDTQPISVDHLRGYWHFGRTSSGARTILAIESQRGKTRPLATIKEYTET